MYRAAASLDVLVSTVTVNLDWNAWLGTLRPNGTFCLLGVPPAHVSLTVWPTMVMRQLSFCVRAIGTPQQISEMLRFAALHNVQPRFEILPMKESEPGTGQRARKQSAVCMVLANS